MNEETLRALLVPLIGLKVTPKTIDMVVQTYKEHQSPVKCGHAWSHPTRPCPYCQQEKMDEDTRSMFIQSFRDADAAFERDHPEAAKRTKNRSLSAISKLSKNRAVPSPELILSGPEVVTAEYIRHVIHWWQQQEAGSLESDLVAIKMAELLRSIAQDKDNTMFAIKPDDTTVKMEGPPGETDVYALHVAIRQDEQGRHYCVSKWEPTPEERALLNAGGSVELWVMGRQPPVALTVVPHAEPLDGSPKNN